jgi:hypothetical protein
MLQRFFFWSFIALQSALACSIVELPGKPRDPAKDIVKGADLIVRATAVEYAVAPRRTGTWTNGTPDSKIRFKINESIRGGLTGQLVLPGYLVDNDDFNDQQPPYSFVRPNGRSGSCYANSYRAGRQFLLFLKRTNSGELTVNWYPLGPVNEQLRSDTDKWLLWVRQQAKT